MNPVPIVIGRKRITTKQEALLIAQKRNEKKKNKLQLNEEKHIQQNELKKNLSALLKERKQPAEQYRRICNRDEVHENDAVCLHHN